MQAFAFDLTDYIRPGEENFVAIEVMHNGISDIGTGGIVFPSYFFTGPRLSKRAPAIDPAIENANKD